MDSRITGQSKAAPLEPLDPSRPGLEHSSPRRPAHNDRQKMSHKSPRTGVLQIVARNQPLL